MAIEEREWRWEGNKEREGEAERKKIMRILILEEAPENEMWSLVVQGNGRKKSPTSLSSYPLISHLIG